VLIPPGGQGQPLTPQPDPSGRMQSDPSGRPQPGTGEVDPEGGPPDENEEIDPGTGIGEKKGIVQVGPFIGVHSRSGKESILIFNGRTRYDEWQFTLEMIQSLLGVGMRPDQPPTPGGSIVGGDPTRVPSLSTRWLGRPLPAFLQPPQSQMPQDGQVPDGRPRQQPPRPPTRR
ncbi:MAG: hypothetical protein ACJ8CN_02960, partial [Gemmatimonadales bacterium]